MFAVSVLVKDSLLTFIMRNLPWAHGNPCGYGVWPALSPLLHKGCSLEQLFIFETHPGTVTLFLNPPSNSYSPYPRPQSDDSGKSEKAAAQSFQTLTRQEKHLLLFCVWIFIFC